MNQVDINMTFRLALLAIYVLRCIESSEDPSGFYEMPERESEPSGIRVHFHSPDFSPELSSNVSETLESLISLPRLTQPITSSILQDESFQIVGNLHADLIITILPSTKAYNSIKDLTASVYDRNGYLIAGQIRKPSDLNNSEHFLVHETLKLLAQGDLSSQSATEELNFEQVLAEIEKKGVYSVNWNDRFLTQRNLLSCTIENCLSCTSYDISLCEVCQENYTLVSEKCVQVLEQNVEYFDSVVHEQERFYALTIDFPFETLVIELRDLLLDSDLYVGYSTYPSTGSYDEEINGNKKYISFQEISSYCSNGCTIYLMVHGDNDKTSAYILQHYFECEGTNVWKDNACVPATCLELVDHCTECTTTTQCASCEDGFLLAHNLCFWNMNHNKIYNGTLGYEEDEYYIIQINYEFDTLYIELADLNGEDVDAYFSYSDIPSPSNEDFDLTSGTYKLSWSDFQDDCYEQNECSLLYINIHGDEKLESCYTLRYYVLCNDGHTWSEEEAKCVVKDCPRNCSECQNDQSLVCTACEEGKLVDMGECLTALERSETYEGSLFDDELDYFRITVEPNFEYLDIELTSADDLKFYLDYAEIATKSSERIDKTETISKEDFDQSCSSSNNCQYLYLTVLGDENKLVSYTLKYDYKCEEYHVWDHEQKTCVQYCEEGYIASFGKCFLLIEEHETYEGTLVDHDYHYYAINVNFMFNTLVIYFNDPSGLGDPDQYLAFTYLPVENNHEKEIRGETEISRSYFEEECENADDCTLFLSILGNSKSKSYYDFKYYFICDDNEAWDSALKQCVTKECFHTIKNCDTCLSVDTCQICAAGYELYFNECFYVLQENTYKDGIVYRSEYDYFSITTSFTFETINIELLDYADADLYLDYNSKATTSNKDKGITSGILSINWDDHYENCDDQIDCTVYISIHGDGGEDDKQRINSPYKIRYYFTCSDSEEGWDSSTKDCIDKICTHMVEKCTACLDDYPERCKTCETGYYAHYDVCLRIIEIAEEYSLPDNTEFALPINSEFTSLHATISTDTIESNIYLSQQYSPLLLLKKNHYTTGCGTDKELAMNWSDFNGNAPTVLYGEIAGDTSSSHQVKIWFECSGNLVLNAGTNLCETCSDVIHMCTQCHDTQCLSCIANASLLNNSCVCDLGYVEAHDLCAFSLSQDDEHSHLIGQNESRYYEIIMPEGAHSIMIKLENAANLSIYVLFDALPSSSSHLKEIVNQENEKILIITEDEYPNVCQNCKLYILIESSQSLTFNISFSSCSPPDVLNSELIMCGLCSSVFELCMECENTNCKTCIENASANNSVCECNSGYAHKDGMCIFQVESAQTVNESVEEGMFKNFELTVEFPLDSFYMAVTNAESVNVFLSYSLIPSQSTNDYEDTSSETTKTLVLSSGDLMSNCQDTSNCKLYVSVLGMSSSVFSLEFITCLSPSVLNPSSGECGACSEVFENCPQCTHTDCSDCVENASKVENVCTCDSNYSSEFNQCLFTMTSDTRYSEHVEMGHYKYYKIVLQDPFHNILISVSHSSVPIFASQSALPDSSVNDFDSRDLMVLSKDDLVCDDQCTLYLSLYGEEATNFEVMYMTCNDPLVLNADTQMCGECSLVFNLCESCDATSCIECKKNASQADNECSCDPGFNENSDHCVQVMEQDIEYIESMDQHDVSYYEITPDLSAEYLFIYVFNSAENINLYGKFAELPTTESYDYSDSRLSTTKNLKIADLNKKCTEATCKIYILVDGVADASYRIRYSTCEEVLNTETGVCDECSSVYSLCKSCDDFTCIECIDNANLKGEGCECQPDREEYNGLCIPCWNYFSPSEIEARYDSNLTKILIEFSTGNRYLYDTCGDIFETDTIGELGEHPECLWIDNRNLEIRLGKLPSYDSKILNIKPTALSKVDEVCTYNYSELKISIGNFEAPVPDFAISGPTEYSLECSDMDILFYVQAISGFGLNPLKYTWTMTGETITSGLTTSVESQTSYQLEIQRALIVIGDFEITVTVTNIFGNSQTKTAGIAVTSGKSFSVRINGGSPQNIESSKSHKFTAFVDEFCSTNTPTFEWKQLESNTIQREYELEIQAYELTANRVYTYEVTVTAGDITGTSQLILNTELSDLVAEIDRTDGSVSNIEDLVLDGSSSYDLNKLDGEMKYTWSCYYSDTDDLCLRSDSSPLVLDESSQIIIDKSHLTLGSSLNFTLNISKDDRTASESVNLYVINSGVAKITVSNHESIYNNDSEISIKSSIDVPYSRVYWEQIVGLSEVPAEGLSNTDIKFQSLSLVPGRYYKYRVVYSTDDGNVWSDVDWYMNLPPLCLGGFQTVTDGDNLIVVFAECYDQEERDYPLRFSVDMNWNNQLLRLIRLEKSFIITLPFLLDNIEIKGVVCDSLDLCTQYESTVASRRRLEEYDVSEKFNEIIVNKDRIPFAVISLSLSQQLTKEEWDLLFYELVEYTDSVEEYDEFATVISALRALVSQTQDIAELEAVNCYQLLSTVILNCKENLLDNERSLVISITEILMSVLPGNMQILLANDDLIHQLLEESMEGISIGSEVELLVTKAYNISRERTSVELISNKTYELGSSILTFQDALPIGAKDIIDLQLSIYSGYNAISDIVEISFKNFSDSTYPEFDLVNLEKPIILQLKCTAGEDSDCAYYSESKEWIGDACTVLKIIDEVCSVYAYSTYTFAMKPVSEIRYPSSLNSESCGLPLLPLLAMVGATILLAICLIIGLRMKVNIYQRASAYTRETGRFDLDLQKKTDEPCKEEKVPEKDSSKDVENLKGMRFDLNPFEYEQQSDKLRRFFMNHILTGQFCNLLEHYVKAFQVFLCFVSNMALCGLAVMFIDDSEEYNWDEYLFLGFVSALISWLLQVILNVILESTKNRKLFWTLVIALIVVAFSAFLYVLFNTCSDVSQEWLILILIAVLADLTLFQSATAVIRTLRNKN